MKVTPLFAAIFALLPFSVFAAVINADSRITEVTVYPDSALVTREAQVKLSPGDHTVVLPGIVPQLNENSLKVSSDEKHAVRLSGVTLRREFLEQVPSEKIRQLQEELQKVQDGIHELENGKNVYQEEKQFLDSLRFYSRDQLPKELATRMPQPGDLEATLKFLGGKLRENYAGMLETELRLREARGREAKLTQELAQLSGPVRKERKSIAIELGAQTSVSCTLRVSYLVQGVHWQPLYDARSDFESQEVELTAYATVRQNSGEDWSDVVMTFSTARPTAGGNLPYVAPWILRVYQPVRMQRAKVAMEQLDMNQYGAFKSEAEGAALPAAPAVAEERGTAVVYKVTRRVTVKADGSEQKLPLASESLKASFEYSSYPRVQQAAFLGSRVANAGNLQLLPGRMNVFLDGEFVGQSALPGVGPGEEFDLYLGVDDNVRVKREQIEKKVDQTLLGSIPGPNKTTRLRYKLTVENYKSRAVKVKLFEAMPVPEDDRIKVKIEKPSLEPSKKDWEDRKGVWLWELELAPRAKQEITYSLAVEHPRDLQVEGL